MNPEPDNDSFLLPTIIGITMLLLGVAFGARMMGLLPNSIGSFVGIRTTELQLLSEASAEPTNPSQAPSNVRARRQCPECGVIVSTRDIGVSASNANGGTAELGGAIGAGGMQGSAVARYEFIVRMQGGARRVIVDTVPTRWREGERVIVIDGATPSER